MRIKNSLLPPAIQYFTSDTRLKIRRSIYELMRVIRGRSRTVTFYHRASDPYSYLLLQVLIEVERCYSVTIELEIVHDLPAEAYPEPEQLAVYALEDCQRLALHHNLSFPAQGEYPSVSKCNLASAILMAQRQNEVSLQVALEVTAALWGNTTTTLESCGNRYGKLGENYFHQASLDQQNKIKQKGHYYSGTLNYLGEWYWGIDRLEHLFRRLDDCHLKTSDFTAIDASKSYDLICNASNSQSIALPIKTRNPATTQVELEFYFSFRSPYSYLALERTFKLVDFYKIPIVIKPVLPMVMRGLTVPNDKRMYILTDAKREANRNGIKFGRIYDPLGRGVERCMAVYEYAQEHNKEQEFLSAVSTGIWSEGVDVSTNRGLATIVKQCGLDWRKAKTHIKSENWRGWAEENRQQLKSHELWGVPCYHYGNLKIWGQDRFWALEQEIIKSLSQK